VVARLENEASDYSTNYGTQENPLYFLNSNCLSGAKADFNNIEECNKVSCNKNNSNLNGSFATSLVGSFSANAQGAFDMAGNVAEWCWDWHGKIEKETVTDPTGAINGKFKITCGGYMSANPLSFNGKFLRSCIMDKRFSVLCLLGVFFLFACKGQNHLKYLCLKAFLRQAMFKLKW